jgi:ABC-type transport system substrate-binding protein
MKNMIFQRSRSIIYLLTALMPMLLMIACSSSKNSVVTVNAPTVSSSKPDTLSESKTTGGTFQSITIWENQPIHTLDPLFVTNESEMRVIQLIYEGLVRFNSQGKIVPAIAKKWIINDQHRQFKFILKQNIFYQDNSIFASGRGRQLKPEDIKKDFERMAHADVPPCAAKLFMDIHGFEPYFQEQHKVYRPSERQFHGISGIKIKNDSTIVFSLVHSDEHFLQKLASPYAVIYPPKAAKSGNFKTVGTGPFKLAQQRADSLYIFARFANYHEKNQPGLNRIDVITSSNGMALLQALKGGSIDLIPELGPQQMQQVSQKNGSLKSSFSQKYHLLKPEERSAVYVLQYNSGADLPENAVIHTLSSVADQGFFPGLPSNAIQFRWSFSGGGSSAAANSLSSSYISDPFIRTFYLTLAKKLKAHNIAFKVKKTRVVNRTIPLQMTRLVAPYAQFQRNGKNKPLGTFTVKIWALEGNYVHHLSFNRYPWWINLRNITVSSTHSP